MAAAEAPLMGAADDYQQISEIPINDKAREAFYANANAVARA